MTWCLPFNHNHYSNRLAVGITDCGENPRHDPKWADEMYYNSNHVTSMQSAIERYRTSTCPVTVSHNSLHVTGTMGTGHHAKISITVVEETARKSVATASQTDTLTD